MDILNFKEKLKHDLLLDPTNDELIIRLATILIQLDEDEEAYLLL